MKKLIPLFIASMAFSGWVHAENAPTSAAVPVTKVGESANNLSIDKNGEMSLVTSDDEAVSLSQNMKITSKKDHQMNAKLSYSIDISYPQIQGETLTDGANDFNKAIEKMVTEEVNQFKKNIALDRVHMQTLPVDMRKNSLKVDYDIDIIKPKGATLISVRITAEGMQAGRPHPYHNNRVVNFDLSTGKMLTLNDLFKKDSKFLQLIAAYTSKALNQKLKNDNWMVAQGTKPDANNFKNWNLQNDSILITFDDYQVAPYVYGSQEVEIPYSELKKVLSAKAPIASCASGEGDCQVG
jgi:hypothetical protein